MKISQTTFHAALLDPELPVPDGLEDGIGQAAGRRFAVYRNNVASSLTDALELSFPAICKLIGENNFRQLAGIFLRQHPPSVPMLSQYGAEMPSFLENFEPLKHIGYLPDIARLEQAIRLSYHAADADPIDPSVLQEFPPERLDKLRFELAPSLFVLTSPWPIHSIWAFNLENGPKPQPGSESVLIMRSAFDPDPTAISAASATFIRALKQGETLGLANESAAQIDNNFDLSDSLAQLLSGQAITRIRTEPSQ